MAIDFAGWTNEQITEAVNDAQAEIDRRNRERNLVFAIESAIRSAKDSGYTKGQVTAVLTRLVNQHYGQ